MEGIEIKQLLQNWIAQLHLKELNSHTLTEGLIRLRRCLSTLRHHPTKHGATTAACELVASIATSVLDRFKGQVNLCPLSEADTYEDLSMLTFGCLNPGRNGLSNIAGSAVCWKRLKDARTGLLKALKDFGFCYFGLPACRLPSDFALPFSSGVDLFSLGGPSYHSVGCLRSLESCSSTAILHNFSSQFFLLLKVDDLIVITFALPTTGQVQNDILWALQLEKGAQAGKLA